MPATPTTLKAIWPMFAAVPDVSVQYWLDQALPAVTWEDGDHAQMLLAAHYMVINGIGSGTDAQLVAQGASGVKSIKSGSLQLDFGPGGSATLGPMATTSFGRQFLDIARAYRGGPFVTSTGTIPWPHQCHF